LVTKMHMGVLAFNSFALRRLRVTTAIRGSIACGKRSPLVANRS
jgi:hypothetical protein